MTALYILLSILLLIFLAAFIKITVFFSYCTQPQLEVKIGFVKIRILPPKDEKEPKKQKKGKPSPQAPKEKKEKPPRRKPPLKELVGSLKEYLIEAVQKMGKYVNVESYRVKILVAGDDPAATALIYGGVCAALRPLEAFIRSIRGGRKNAKKITTEIETDFLAEDFEIDFSASFSIRIWQTFSLGITGGKALMQFLSMTKPIKTVN